MARGHGGVVGTLNLLVERFAGFLFVQTGVGRRQLGLCHAVAGGASVVERHRERESDVLREVVAQLSADCGVVNARSVEVAGAETGIQAQCGAHARPCQFNLLVGGSRTQLCGLQGRALGETQCVDLFRIARHGRQSVGGGRCHREAVGRRILEQLRKFEQGNHFVVFRLHQCQAILCRARPGLSQIHLRQAAGADLCCHSLLLGQRIAKVGLCLRDEVHAKEHLIIGLRHL